MAEAAAEAVVASDAASIRSDRQALTALTSTLRRGDSYLRDDGSGTDLDIREWSFLRENGWGTDLDIREWSGVKLDTEGRVIGLDVSFLHKGSLFDRSSDWEAMIEGVPDEVFALTALETLVLPSIRNSGKVLAKVARLSKLKTLRLTITPANDSLGPISPQLFGLTALQTLELLGIEPDGASPAGIGRLQKLKKLSLRVAPYKDRNIGPLPPELFGLTTLEKLSLDGFEHKGPLPAEIGHLSLLISLKLASGSIRGLLPSDLFGLTALEELNMSGNRLGGLLPAEIGNLSLLTSLSLDYGGLEGPLPSELFGLTALEELNMSGNILGGPLPPQIGRLSRLNKILLGSCGLQGPLPSELSGLTALEMLDLGLNELSGPLPPELFGLTALEYLDLTGNKLCGSVPPEIGRLSRLKTLWLAQCGLGGVLPPELANLTSLQRLFLGKNNIHGRCIIVPIATVGGDDVSFTDIFRAYRVSYPEGYGTSADVLASTWHLNQEVNEEGTSRWRLGFSMENPWGEPPAAVVNAGPAAVEAYFADIFREGSVHYRALKVVLVGKQGAGKTSLGESIRTGRPFRTAGSQDSTVHMEIKDAKLGNVSVRLFDCAGQVAYQGLLQLFLTRRAVYLLVFEISDKIFSEGQHPVMIDAQGLEALGILPWLWSFSFRLPEGSVILVGNKCDEYVCTVESVVQAASTVEEACRTWNPSSGGRSVGIEKGVSLTACHVPAPAGLRARFASSLRAICGCVSATGAARQQSEGWPCDWHGAADEPSPISLIDRITSGGRRVDNASRAEATLLPKSWKVALDYLNKLPVEDNVMHVSREELFGRWNRYVSEQNQDILNPEGAMDGALTIRTYEGTVLAIGQRLFLDVGWLARVLEPLLNHKGIVQAGVVEKFGDLQITEGWQRDALRRLEKEGILESTLADFLWGDVSEDVLATLRHIGLIFSLPGGKREEYVVLLRLLDKDCPHDLAEQRAAYRADKEEGLHVRWGFPRGVPPGAIERVIALTSWLGSPIFYWRHGVMISVHRTDPKESFETAHLLLEYDEGAKKLAVSVWGSLTTVSPWFVLSFALSTIRKVTLEFPGLPWDAELECPEHDSKTMTISREDTFGENLISRDGLCGQCRCRRAQNGPGVLAGKLLKIENPFRKAEKMFESINDRFIKLKGAAVVNTSRAKQVDDQTASDIFLAAVESLHVKMDRVIGDTAKNNTRIPSCAILLPPRANEETCMTEAERMLGSWKQRLQAWHDEGKRGGRGMVRRDLRLFFLCGHDYSLAKCGLDGKGYRIKSLRGWAEKAIPVARGLLVVTSIATKFFLGGSIPVEDLLGAAVSGIVDELEDVVVDAAFEGPAERLEASGEGEEKMRDSGIAGQGYFKGITSQQARPDLIPTAAMKEVANMVQELEKIGRKKFSARFCCFEGTMEFVNRAGHGQEWAWVRKGNIQAFRKS